MNKKNVLICGATGFIGRNIAEYFAKDNNYKVYGTFHNSKPLNSRRITMIRADLTTKKDVALVVRGKDIIIQAAAITSGSKDIVSAPYLHVTDNAVINSHIFRSAFEQKVSHLIFFSCSIMYGSSDSPVKESDFDANQDVHPSYFGAGWTKVYLEKMCEFYSRIGDTKYTVIRHSNIYGPYDKFDQERSHVFGATITKVMTAGKRGQIAVWGSGKEEKDMLYISDLIHFVKLSIKKQRLKFSLFNVGCGSSISVGEMVKKIIVVSGKDLKIRYDLSKPNIQTKVCLDISKARRDIGWSPKIDLQKGIKLTLDWYKKFRKKGVL